MAISENSHEDSLGCVFAVELDPWTARCLKRLSSERAFEIRWCATSKEFFRQCYSQRPSCALIGWFATEQAVLDFLEESRRRGICLPVIVFWGREEIRPVVRMMRAGAWGVLKTPSSEEQITQVIQEAMAWDMENRLRHAQRMQLQMCLARLTHGEMDVLRLLLEGESNQSMAARLGISIRGVESRRAKLMRKMKASSMAELIRLVLTALPEWADHAGSEPRSTLLTLGPVQKCGKMLS